MLQKDSVLIKIYFLWRLKNCGVWLVQLLF
jgi:hypothetical protein